MATQTLQETMASLVNRRPRADTRARVTKADITSEVAATVAVEEDTAQAATEAEEVATEAEEEVATEAEEEALDTVLVKSTLAANTAVRTHSICRTTVLLHVREMPLNYLNAKEAGGR